MMNSLSYQTHWVDASIYKPGDEVPKGMYLDPSRMSEGLIGIVVEAPWMDWELEPME